MPEYTKDEALAFVDAMRLMLNGKVGFKWYAEKLAGLAAYIESVAVENERTSVFLDEAGLRDDYVAFCETYHPVTREDEAPTETGARNGK